MEIVAEMEVKFVRLLVWRTLVFIYWFVWKVVPLWGCNVFFKMSIHSLGPSYRSSGNPRVLRRSFFFLPYSKLPVFWAAASDPSLMGFHLRWFSCLLHRFLLSPLFYVLYHSAMFFPTVYTSLVLTLAYFLRINVRKIIPIEPLELYKQKYSCPSRKEVTQTHTPTYKYTYLQLHT